LKNLKKVGGAKLHDQLWAIEGNVNDVQSTSENNITNIYASFPYKLLAQSQIAAIDT